MSAGILDLESVAEYAPFIESCSHAGDWPDSDRMGGVKGRNQPNQPPTASPRSRRFLEYATGSLSAKEVIDLPEPSAKRISAPTLRKEAWQVARSVLTERA